MSVVVSGTLKSPDGEAISGANITLTALTVSPDALSGTSASAVTREGGYYGMTMDPGEYAVSVTVKGKTAVYGRVRIEGTESTVTLNMLLRRSLVEVSIPGELLTDFRQIQNNVADDLATIRRLNEDTATKNTQATQSKDSAAASAKSASDSAKTATSRAAEAGQKASEAAEAATRACESEKAAAADANDARQHAETARVAHEAAGDVLKRAEAATVSAEEARRMAENARGPKGDTGPKGDAGPRGETGPQGAQGPRGETGPVGPQGERGIQGPAGPRGETGARGEKGAPGDPGGPPGPKGDAGPKGDTGPAGPAGEKGEPGERGPQGEQGLRGPAGERGPAGPQGPKGDAGATGPAGPKGERGEAGPEGPRGEPGPAGSAANVVDATTAQKGNVQLSSDTASNDETKAATSKAVKAAMDEAKAARQKAEEVAAGGGVPGPKGDKGDTGPAGPQGPKGDTGAPGQGTELLTTANTWTQAQTFNGGINGNLTVTGNGSFNDVQIRSDKRNKRNLVKLDNALDRLEALTGYLYEIQYSADGWQTSVGLIAQDAQKALPELVTEDADVISGEKRLRLNYNGIIALLVEGFKTLRHEIKELREK